jgi:hypothetical protein
MQTRKHTFWISCAILGVVVLALLTALPAAAHTRVELGPYVLILGWEQEPVVVGERNALVLEVTEDGQPVEGLESTLDFVVLYGGQTFTGNLNPTTTPGYYSAEILPTVRGQYSVQLSGSIEDLQVNEILEPEEVLPAGVLQFPESPPDTRDLQVSIDALTSELQTARTLTIVALALAVIAIGIAVLAVIRGRR